ncbi:hypothetical protein B0813_000252 [Candidatus Fervidibacteria bacterium JGI MDM2 SSWTFF-3-K9]|jgi:hypothetical protein
MEKPALIVRLLVVPILTRERWALNLRVVATALALIAPFA